MTDTRTATWANIGTQYNPNDKIINGLPESMCFEVEKVPLGYISDGNFIRSKGDSVVINKSTGKSYGRVSDNYLPINNIEALGVLQDTERMGMEIVKYGETYRGMQYVIGKLEDVNILGDKFTPYLVYRNSFNGRYPIQVAITPLRIVCQNQLNWAFKNAQNAISIRHSAKAEERINDAQRILCTTADYMKELNKEAEKYASIKLSGTQKQQIISQLFPITNDMTDRQKENIQAKSVAYQVALLRPDLTNFKDTAWEIVQAYADYVSHPVIQRNTQTMAENTFMSVTFDPRIMQNLMSILDKVA